MAIISIPVPLRKLTQGHDTWQLSWASNIEECILELEEAWPGIRERIVNEDGKIRQFVNIYLNGQKKYDLSALNISLSISIYL